MSDPNPKEPWDSVLRATRAFREGKVPDEKCPVCGGLILVAGQPAEAPTHFGFTCPCKKSHGFLVK